MHQSFINLISITGLGGRMHPVVVHLPIGILFLVCLYYIFASAEKRRSQESFIGFALLAGMITAIAACVSGLLLANSGDYDQAAVAPHQWMGILTAAMASACYVIHRLQIKLIKAFMVLLVICITVAGHLGGAITHGADYLTALLQTRNAAEFKPIPNVQEAIVYNDIIKPILSAKCYSCHGSSKQKGKLRLDEPDYILKGGKGGVAIDWNHAENSLLVERILLPQSDEDHMPPKEKAQLTRQEIDLLHWWVNSGAGFSKKVNQSIISDKVKPILAALQTGNVNVNTQQSAVPDDAVAAAGEEMILALRKRGVVIIPVASRSHYLSANFVSAETVTAEDLKLLGQLKDQLIWLKIGYKNLKDDDLKSLGELKNLRRLYLEGNPITDVGISFLTGLHQLQYLNLSGTRISSKGSEQLVALKKLEELYLYNISKTVFDLTALKKRLPNTIIDTGGYELPILESDTAVLNGAVSK